MRVVGSLPARQKRVANVLEARAIRKVFPGVVALDSVDFQVRQGEIMGLLGGNGAGKSTLINILAGVLKPEAGQIYLDGRRAELRNPTEALNSGLAFLFQDLHLVPYLTVAENIFLGRLMPNRWGLVDQREMTKGAAKLLLTLRAAGISPESRVSELTPHDRYIVAIGRALARKASVLFLDEPTASLTGEDVESLFQSLRKLRDQGVAIVLVTHRIEEALAICDRITIFRDGRLLGVFGRADVDAKSVAFFIAGGEIERSNPEAAGGHAGAPLLRVQDLMAPGVHNVSFELLTGEIVGFVGVVGSGASDLLRALYGLAGRTSGRVELEGQQVHLRDPAECINRGLFLLPRDRKREGLFPSRLARENISIASLATFGPFLPGVIDGVREKNLAAKLGHLVGLPGSLEATIATLSGGTQQKVLVARALGARAKVLMLDEPTAGLDVRAKADLKATFRDLVQRGLGIILHDSAFGEFIGICDRFLVMKGGSVVAEVRGDVATEKELAFLSYYGSPPAISDP